MTRVNKQEFLERLRASLNGLPSDDIEERIAFYNEMLDDKIEEGMSEQEAVKSVGSIEKIVIDIVDDIPLAKIAKERIKPKRQIKVWEIVLLALGSPIWLSLIIALIAVIFSVYVSLWSVIISLWSVFASLVACAVGGVVACAVFSVTGSVYTGVAMLSAGLVCAGLSIFMFYCCKLVTKGILFVTKKIVVWLKNCFIKKEEA
jgi:uncharacterized membrane protein